MADLNDKFRGTMPVRDKVRFDPAPLEAWMKQHVEGFSGPLDVSQFKGGQSNPTYLLEAGGTRYVLRRKPPGKLLPSAHAVDREYRIMTALADTPVPVPRTYALCEDAEVVGTPFFIMEHVEGRIFWNGLLPDMSSKQRLAIYEAMNTVMADLHGVDYAAVGLESYGKPSGYIARQVRRWSKQYQASETEPIPEMNHLIAWLPEHLPEHEETSIVHGDYRLDNMIFHPNEPRVLAVLDWELSTLGHPLADFAYHCMIWHIPPFGTFGGLAGADFEALGIPDEETYKALYYAKTGRDDVSRADWTFFIAYNLFRAAAIFQGIAKRVVDGTAASKHGAAMGALAQPIAQLAWSKVEALR